jgi:SulP family sulfate permease
MSVVFTEMIAKHPDTGIALAFSSVIIAGVFQILFGFAKLGKYFVMVPYPVISGFMSGIGVIIILLQIAPLVGGVSLGSSFDTIVNLPYVLADTSVISLIFGLFTLLLMSIWPAKWNKVLPSSLCLLVVTTILSAWYFSDTQLPSIGEIPSAFPQFHFPMFSLDVFQDVIYFGFLIAILGAIDSLLTSLVADAMTGTQHDSNKELIGQGIGNAFAGLFHALPGAGATMRTTVNIRAGGQSAFSGVTHSIVLLVVVLWAGQFAQYIPHAVLAGILIKVGIDIIDWQYFSRLKHMPIFSTSLMLLVLALTVFVDLITAVLVGMFIANIVTIERIANVEIDNIVFRRGDDLIGEKNDTLSRTLIFEVDGPVSFAVSRELSRRFSDIHDFDFLLIDLSRARIIGTTCAVMIIDMIESNQKAGKEVIIVLGDKHVNKTLTLLSLNELVPENQQYKESVRAIEDLQNR